MKLVIKYLNFLNFDLYYVCNLINHNMKKKFAICLVHGYFENFYSIFNQDGYGTCMVPCEVVFESDNFWEVSDEYTKYKNIKISK